MNYTVGQQFFGGAVVVGALDTDKQQVTFTFPLVTSGEGPFSVTYSYGVTFATVAAAYAQATGGQVPSP